MSEELSDAQIQSIMTALREGSRDQAIQVYQQATGCGAQAAEDAVQQLAERFGLAEAPQAPSADDAPRAETPKLANEQVAQIADEIAQGRKVNAIKIYRDATGCDLQTAMDFINRLNAASGGKPVTGQSGSRGCLGMALALGALGLGVCYGAARLIL